MRCGDTLRHERLLGYVACDTCKTAVEDRALCALSEDRQWLVVLRPAGDWMVHHWIELNQSWYARQFIPDTGQDARDVLDAWLEEQTHA